MTVSVDEELSGVTQGGGGGGDVTIQPDTGASSTGTTFTLTSPDLGIAGDGVGTFTFTNPNKLVQIGTGAAPISVSGEIPTTADLNSHIYVVASQSVVTGSIANGQVARQRITIHYVGYDRINLASSSNLKLAGDIVLGDETILMLHWDSTRTKWVELGRNEISEPTEEEGGEG